MSIIIKLSYPFSNIVGGKTLCFQFGGATVEDLIEELAKRYGSQIKEELLEKGEGHPTGYAIFVNQKIINSLSALVRDEDEVIILPQIGGG